MALAIVLCLMIFAGLRLGWGQVEQSVLSLKLAELDTERKRSAIASDGPATLDAQNAAQFYEDAARVCAIPDVLEGLLNDYSGYPEVADEYPHVLERVIKNIGPALKLVREAREHPSGPPPTVRVAQSAISPEPRTGPAVSLVRPPRGVTFTPQQIALPQLLATASLWAARHDEPVEAVAFLRDLLAFSDYSASNFSGLSEYNQAMSRVVLASRTAERILPLLESGLQRADARSAQLARQVEALRDALLEDGAQSGSLALAVRGERDWAIELSLDALRRGPVTSVGLGQMPPAWVRGFWAGLLFQPLLLRDAGTLLDEMNRAERIASANTYSAADGLLSKFSPRHDPFGNLKFPFSENLRVGAMERHILLHHRALMERRLAAIGVAMILYSAGEGGPPERLQDLVPRYLKYIPADTFSPGSEPVRYATESSPRLYSVYIDGRDDGGWWSRPQSGVNAAPAGWSQRGVLDLVFWLDDGRPRRPRSGPPPTLPAEYQRQP